MLVACASAPTHYKLKSISNVSNNGSSKKEVTAFVELYNDKPNRVAVFNWETYTLFSVYKNTGDNGNFIHYAKLTAGVKPDIELAKQYLASGEYLWNSGMFVWKVSTILDNFKKYMQDIYEGLVVIKNSIGTADYESVLKDTFRISRLWNHGKCGKYLQYTGRFRMG